MERFRLGFVGGGRTARRHAGVLAGFDDVRIAGIADSDPALASDFAARTGGQPFASVGAMLATLALDALVICVPPGEHGMPERVALAHGLPFLVEPPLARDAATAREIAEGVRAIGLPTAVSQPWRHLEIVEAALRRLDGRRARFVTALLPATGGHEPLFGQATRLVDLARLFGGEPVEARAALAEASGAAALLRCDTGAIASLAAVPSPRGRARLAIFAETFTLEFGTRALLAEEEALRRQDRAFIDAVLGRGDGIRVPYAEAFRTHLATLAVARALETGGPAAIETY